MIRILLVSFALCMVGDGTHRDVLIYMDWITRALKKTMSGKRPNSGKLFFWVCLLYERRRKIHVFTHRNRFTILVNRTTRLNYYILLTCRKMWIFLCINLLKWNFATSIVDFIVVNISCINPSFYHFTFNSNLIWKEVWLTLENIGIR
jgi:hypothetical protein